MTPAEERAYRDGFVAGRVAERLGIGETPDFPRPMSVIEAERRHLHIVPVDAPTAEILSFPTTEKTAS